MIHHPFLDRHGIDAPRQPMLRMVLPASVACVQLVLAYEWLISGINKIVNPNFTAQLAGTITDGMKGNPYTAYVSFLQSVVLPHSGLFGVLTELSECAIGLVLLISAALWSVRPTHRIAVQAGKLACCALAGATFLSVNYFLQGGSPMPWVNPANAFSEGVDIDVLLPLISVTVLMANVRAVRRLMGQAPAEYDSERLSWAS